MNRTLIRQSALAVGVLTLTALVSVVAPSSVAAQPSPDVELAGVSVFHGGVDFRPNVSYRRAVVTVSGGGQTFKQTFDGSKGISIGSFDPEGSPLADGVYTWELELAPDARTARDLRIAASRNGGIAPGAWRPQSGTFTISSGSIASPDGTEPEPPRLGLESGLSALPVDLVPQRSLSRVAVSEDSDRAVEAGSVELEVRAASAARGASEVNMNFAQGLSEDNDATAASMGGTLERPMNESEGPSLRAFSARQVKPDDGSSGRKPGSTPDN